MNTRRPFQAGRSLAVRLPKNEHVVDTDVVDQRVGNGVLLPVEGPWTKLDAGLAAFEPGFALTREQPLGSVRTPIGASDTLIAGRALNCEPRPSPTTPGSSPA